MLGGSEDIDLGSEVNFETTVTASSSPPPDQSQPPLRQGACPCSCRRTCGLAVEFTVDTNMGPNGKLTVYTTLTSGEMVVDTVDFSIDNVFANKVRDIVLDNGLANCVCLDIYARSPPLSICLL